MRPILTWTAVCVATAVFAFGSIWPFWTAWEIRESPPWLASQAWITASPVLAERIGPNVRTESDWFPKGGTQAGLGRYEFKVVGDRGKAKVSVLLEERAGTWNVTRAAVQEAGEWKEI